MDDGTRDRRQFLKKAGAGAALGTIMTRPGAGSPSEEPEVAPPATSRDLCFMTARELAALIRTRKVSAREVMAAHLDQIRRLNPRINAIVAKLDDEKCLALAGAADQRAGKQTPPELGPLHGLPIAFKDLQPAAGFPFTRGSPIYKDTIPAEDSVLVERLRKAGAIPIGKTNVPEFGMG